MSKLDNYNFHLEDQTLNKPQKLDPKKASQVNH